MVGDGRPIMIATRPTRMYFSCSQPTSIPSINDVRRRAASLSLSLCLSGFHLSQ